MLDVEIKKQLDEYLQLLENPITITASVGSDPLSPRMLNFLEELASMSPKITLLQETLDRSPSFLVDGPEGKSGIQFAGIPMGHEFNSLVLALVQASGRPPKIEDSQIQEIKAIKGEYHFETFISLTCHNCPDIVQALNTMSILNPGISHTMIDGAAYRQEAKDRDIMNVPTVFLNGEVFGVGRMSLEDILAKLGTAKGPEEYNEKDPFDVLVVGGGPSGSAAAVYAARKGIRTGLVVDHFGGQVTDTLGIENLISVKYTEGPALASALEAHVGEYNVDIMKGQRAKSLKTSNYIEIELENGGILRSKTVILSTGARWRNVNVPGEQEFKNKGVAYCPHCDGPLYKDKNIAVIGGGNSGVEAAIDLAGIAGHVTVLEFLPELKADSVLVERLNSLPNVTVLKNVATKEITGDTKVNGIDYEDRSTGQVHHIEVEGVFVQIGLVPNTDWLGDTLERNRIGEIQVDQNNRTSIPGVFAAGDCTTSPYKQIVISMGSGATAALSAFDYLIRN